MEVYRKSKGNGAYKALVTFETKEDREEAINSRMELLLNHFAEVRC